MRWLDVPRSGRDAARGEGGLEISQGDLHQAVGGVAVAASAIEAPGIAERDVLHARFHGRGDHGIGMAADDRNAGGNAAVGDGGDGFVVGQCRSQGAEGRCGAAGERGGVDPQVGERRAGPAGIQRGVSIGAGAEEGVGFFHDDRPHRAGAVVCILQAAPPAGGKVGVHADVAGGAAALELHGVGAIAEIHGHFLQLVGLLPCQTLNAGKEVAVANAALVDVRGDRAVAPQREVKVRGAAGIGGVAKRRSIEAGRDKVRVGGIGGERLIETIHAMYAAIRGFRGRSVDGVAGVGPEAGVAAIAGERVAAGAYGDDVALHRAAGSEGVVARAAVEQRGDVDGGLHDEGVIAVAAVDGDFGEDAGDVGGGAVAGDGECAAGLRDNDRVIARGACDGEAHQAPFGILRDRHR